VNPVLFIGETLVDLICKRPVSDWSEADTFTPHCGGAVTNAAIVAARCGAAVALGGGVGDDQWGHWLERRLLEEQVDLRWWSRLRGQETAVAFVVIDEHAVPEFLIYGRGIEGAMKSLRPGIDAAVGSSAAIMLGSNTFVGESEREISRRAQKLALSTGKPILFDVNLRLHRWRSPEAAADLVKTFCEGALLVKVNGDEARLLTGEDDPATAAEVVCSSLGARIAVVTLGAEGAVMRGEAVTEADGIEASVVDTTGAGDALTGVLVAALVGADFDPKAAAQALPLAVEIAARATEGFGATDSIPRSISLPL
jgi:sugar/nucleoside kinase (ribokinase family)